MLDDERDRGHPAPDDRGHHDQEAAGQEPDEDYLQVLQSARRLRVAKVVVALAIVIILIVFVVANAKPVPVSFVFVTRHPELIWVMLACAVLGGIAGYLIGRPGKQVHVGRPDAQGHDRERRADEGGS